MTDSTPLDLDEIIKGLCGSDSLPDEPILSPLRMKLQTIYEKLEGHQSRDPLLKMIAEREKLRDAPSGPSLVKVAIVLSTDWDSLSGEAIFKYLAGPFTGETKIIGATLDKELEEKHTRVSDAVLVQEQDVKYDIADSRRTDNLLALLKEGISARRAADEHKSKVDTEKARERNLGQTGFALQDTTKVNALWSLPPGVVVTEKEQRAKEAEKAKIVVKERRRSKWKGKPADFDKSLEADREQFDAEVEAEVQTQLVTYIRRDNVRSYMFEWKWHFDERVADRRYKLLQTMSSPEKSPTLLIPDALLFREIQRDLGSSYPEDLRNSTEGFIDLVSTYVAMDELRQSLEEPISSMDDYHQNMEIGKRHDLSKAMKALFVQDQGFSLLQQCASIDDLEAARLANKSERLALHYFKTGEMPENVTNFTKAITFADLDASVKRLAVSYYTKNPNHSQVEDAFLKDLEKLQVQMGDFLSEKFYLVDKQLGFHGITGRVAYIANSFLSEDKKKKLETNAMQAESPLIGALINVAAVTLMAVDFLKRIKPEHRNTPNPARLIEEASREAVGHHSARILAERAAAAEEIILQ